MKKKRIFPPKAERKGRGLTVEIFFLSAGGLFALFCVWCLVISQCLTVRRLSVTSPKLPESFEGYTVVLLSDLHDSTFGRENRRLIEKVRALSPDVILFGGDMHQTENDAAYLSLIESLRQIAPVYSCEGNHDPYYHLRPDYSVYLKKTEAAGLVNLTGRIFLESAAGEKIALTGESYHAYVKGRISFDEQFFNLCLLHNPMWFDDFEQKPDLMLAGHVHGGFIRLPFVGGVFAPGAGASLFHRFSREFWFPKYTDGLYGDENGQLAVSQGLGLTARFPFRPLPPEIVCVTLHRG